MALTSFIKIPQLKQKLKEKFPVPKIKLDYPIQVPLKTKNWTQLGTAFDYLLRFYLKQISPESIDTPWVAEGSVYKIKESSGQYVVVDGKLEKLEMKNLNKIYNEYLKKYPRGSLLSGNSKFADKYDEAICKQFGHVRQKSMSWGEPSEEWSKAIKPAEKIILDAKERYSEFLDTGKIKNNLIESSLKLAQLDLVRRAGILEINKKISKQDIDELRDLLDVAIQSKIFKKNKKYYLNPTFGKGSELVGGADADIVMDNTLVDIKVTKKLSFTQEWYNQIIGYYALSTVDNKPTKIRHIGIYFARHGILHTISIKDIEKKSDFKKIIKWFELIAANIEKREMDWMNKNVTIGNVKINIKN